MQVPRGDNMNTKKIFGGLMSILMAVIVFAHSPQIAEAEIYKGMAAIVNGDRAKAEREAREDAMRNCVENKFGAHVTSSTEVSLGMVVSDKIMVNADGYVSPRGTPKFTEKDGIIICEIDLEANTTRIAKLGDDIRSQIQNAINADTTGRTNIVVAVSGRDEGGALYNDSNTFTITTYLEDVMTLQGFIAHAPDEVAEYICRQDFDNPVARAEARKQVRNWMPQANGILRGSLSTVKIQKSGGMYTAMVKATFQLVGIVSSEVNSYTEYFTAADTDRDLALDKARKRAAQKSSEEIARRAAETLQGETRGGVQHTKVQIEIAGIVDRTAQGEKVLAAIKNANCRVIRSLYDRTAPTTLKVFVDATGAGSLDEIKSNIKAQLPGILEDGDENLDARGSAKIYLRYRG